MEAARSAITFPRCPADRPSSRRRYMNNHRQSKNRGRAFAKGQAMVELAGAIFVLVPLLLAAADFGRLYYTNIEVMAAARAGAQYGSQSVTTAANTPGIRSTASNEAHE